MKKDIENTEKDDIVSKSLLTLNDSNIQLDNQQQT